MIKKVIWVYLDEKYKESFMLLLTYINDCIIVAYMMYEVNLRGTYTPTCLGTSNPKVSLKRSISNISQATMLTKMTYNSH
jgi:hypothetical protein